VLRACGGDGLTVERQLIGELLGGMDRVDVVLIVRMSGQFRQKVRIGRWLLRDVLSWGWSVSQLVCSRDPQSLPLKLYCSYINNRPLDCQCLCV
jgi:hypothetical protein